MVFELEQLCLHRARERKWVEGKHFREAMSIYRLNKGSKTLMDIFLGREFLSRARAEQLDLEVREEGRRFLVEGYELQGLISAGAMGVVYRARQISMDRPVALKVLSPELTSDPAFVERFVREARSAGRLNHPNIVHGIDVGEFRGVHYFAMELVDGDDLLALLKKREYLPEGEALQVVAQIAAALEHAWEFEIVHRDIKPENIILTSRGEAKLADLGLAKGNEPEDASLTTVGQVVGTPFYMAPEQTRGAILDTRSDIYSLGITLFTMLTGHPPFREGSITEIMRAHLKKELPPANERQRLTEGVSRFLVRMTEKDPEKRFQTPTELVSAIAVLRGTGESTSVASGRISTVVESAAETTSGGARRDVFRFFRLPDEEEVYFAQIAVHNKVVSSDQVRVCLEVMDNRAEMGSEERLDEIMIAKGLVTATQARKIATAGSDHSARERSLSFGRLAMQMGKITRAQLDEAIQMQEKLTRQGKPRRLLGEVLVGLGHMSTEDVERVVVSQARKIRQREDRTFGQIAFKCKMIADTDFQEAMEIQQQAPEHDIPSIGDILVRLGRIGGDQRRAVLRAQRLTEVLGDKPRRIVQDLLDHSAEVLEEDSAEVGGLFDNLELKAAADICPYCEADVERGAKKCSSCGKAIG